MPKTILKISIDTDNYSMLNDLANDSLMSKSELINYLLSDYFNLTNRMGLIRDILVNHEIKQMID